MTRPAPQLHVDVVERGGKPRRNRERCEIGRNLRFDASRLSSYCLRNWNNRIFDAFVLAAAVQFCDHTTARSYVNWARTFSVQIPVHEPDRWNAPQVSTPLIEALNLVTGDEWHIDFVGRRATEPPPLQRFLRPPAGSPCIVVPYSDGLDSLMVARLIESKDRGKLIRVRLGTTSVSNGPSANGVVPFASVPYRVSYGPRRAVEGSARSRGFRFALLSGVAAYLAQTTEVILPESGQGSLGPSLIPVGQAERDYRTHPVFTTAMENFLSALLGHRPRYAFPQLWSTKGETLRLFLENSPKDESWIGTRSCWQDPRHVSVEKKWRQCGVCAACMLRRMSVHAAGAKEPKTTYVWEDLSVERYEAGAARTFEKRQPKGAMHEYAVAGTLHLEHLARLSRRLGEDDSELDLDIFRLAEALASSDLTAEEKIRTRLFRMLGAHEQEWNAFLDELGPGSFVTRWATRFR